MGYLKLYQDRRVERLGKNHFFLGSTYAKKEVPQKKRIDYYSFGLATEDSWTRVYNAPNKYLYNGGSELNEETKNYETFYRPYDPALGRFTQVDIMASKYSSSTPYNYAFNDPIFFNDPMGDEPSFIYMGRMMNERDRRLPGYDGSNSWDKMYSMALATAFPGNGIFGLSNFYGETYAEKVDREAREEANEEAKGGVIASISAGLAGNGSYWHHMTPDRYLLFNDSQAGNSTAFAFGANYNNLHNSWGHTSFGGLEGSASIFNLITGRIDFTIGTGDLDYVVASNGGGRGLVYDALWAIFEEPWFERTTGNEIEVVGKGPGNAKNGKGVIVEEGKSAVGVGSPNDLSRMQQLFGWTKNLFETPHSTPDSSIVINPYTGRPVVVPGNSHGHHGSPRWGRDVTPEDILKFSNIKN